MAFSKFLLVSLSIASLAVGQNANGTDANGELGIQVIQANFKQAAISGQNNLVPDFEPSALLTASFPGLGAVNPGQEVSVDQSKSAPTLSITPANSSVSLSGNYTLMMVDADVVGAAANSNTRHWLVNGVTVTSGTISNSTGNAPEPYMGPLPAAGSGKHRYVLLVYEQPANFSNPAEFQGGIQKINLQEYVQSSGLGHLVAATYIQVEQGTASSSVSVTSGVVTSTLPAAQSTGASSGSLGTTGTGTASAGSPASTGGALSTSTTSLLTLAIVALSAVFIL